MLTSVMEFRSNWSADLLSGFLVSLIALPLCLGIAGASNFPPIMGVLTAIVGGLVVSFFAGSEPTIKGPAAGLIVIVAGAVEELGKGDIDLGWKLSLGVIVFSGALQVLLGWLKVARLADFFPLAAVHGMLAAIGLIILSKQLHLAVGIAPADLKGRAPLELMKMVPYSLSHMQWQVALIGAVSLLILFGMPALKSKTINKIPPALVVLIVGVLLGQSLHLTEIQNASQIKPLVNPGEFSLNWHVSFGGISGDLLPVFLKYLAMFTLIGSLETLLTGKAIDLLDPLHRKSDLSKDLTAIGIGNMVSGLLGGLPMIGEVARSSANIANGGRTRWANFFHGMCLLLFVVALVPLIKLVPVAALAAMLISVGYRLANPKELRHMYQIGKEQLIVFVVTIIATLATDLLIGIGVGILVELLIQLMLGLPVKYLFRPEMNLVKAGNQYRLTVLGSAVFTNYLAIKEKLDAIPAGKAIVVDLEHARYVDHTVMENLHHYQMDYRRTSGTLSIVNIEAHSALSAHPLAARRKTNVFAEVWPV